MSMRDKIEQVPDCCKGKSIFECIYRDLLINELTNFGWGDTSVVDIVKEFPSADVAPVTHGRWDDSGRYTFPGGYTAVRCTNCGCALTESEYRLNNWNYCPVCGAKMDGERKDKANES